MAVVEDDGEVASLSDRPLLNDTNKGSDRLVEVAVEEAMILVATVDQKKLESKTSHPTIARKINAKWSTRNETIELMWVSLCAANNFSKTFVIELSRTVVWRVSSAKNED